MYALYTLDTQTMPVPRKQTPSRCSHRLQESRQSGNALYSQYEETPHLIIKS
jgi:hypothetical protein